MSYYQGRNLWQARRLLCSCSLWFLEALRLLCFQLTDHMPRPYRGTSGSENSESPTDSMPNFLLSLKFLPSGKSHHSLRPQLEPSQLAAASHSMSLVTQAPMFRAPYTDCSPSRREEHTSLSLIPCCWMRQRRRKRGNRRRNTWMMIPLFAFSHVPSLSHPLASQVINSPLSSAT